MSEPLKPGTTAEPKGDGFVLSGSKSFVVLGDRASHFLVTARNNGDGVDAFIVPRDAAGLTISEPEKNMGMRGSRRRRSNSSASKSVRRPCSAGPRARTCRRS